MAEEIETLEKRLNIIIFDETNHATGKRSSVSLEKINDFLKLLDISFNGPPTFAESVDKNVKILEVAPELDEILAPGLNKERYVLEIVGRKASKVIEKYIFKTSIDMIPVVSYRDIKTIKIMVNPNEAGMNPDYQHIIVYNVPFYKVDEISKQHLERDKVIA